VFLPNVANAKERRIVDLLHGINELHHTVANQVTAYSFGEQGYPADLFARQLIEVADQYGLRDLLAQTVDFVRSRNLSNEERNPGQ
jgi:hypothetical protein